MKRKQSLRLIGRIALFTAAAAVSGLALAAHASEPFVHQVTVSHADLNLDTAAGSQTMYRRLQTAAREVCSHMPITSNPRSLLAQQSCYQESLAKAVDSLGSESVATLYRATAPSRVALTNSRGDAR